MGQNFYDDGDSVIDVGRLEKCFSSLTSVLIANPTATGSNLT
jgi:hypothetical protein